MAKRKHVCKPAAPVCCCYMLAGEPSWDCPIHGGALVNRCDCGRFVRAVAMFQPPADDGRAHPEPESGK